jgi:hypothetical protein
MLIFPLFVTYLESNKKEYVEKFYNENNYNTYYDKNGDPIQINSYKYDIISILYLFMRGYSANHYYRWGVFDNICVILLYILAFLISSLAAYLSFTCTWKGIVSNLFVRLFFAFVAFMLGPFYFIWFFFVNYLGKMC